MQQLSNHKVVVKKEPAKGRKMFLEFSKAVKDQHMFRDRRITKVQWKQNQIQIIGSSQVLNNLCSF